MAILTHKDHQTHEWRGNKHTLARICHFSVEEAEQALTKLSEPDPSSLTPDENGSRIVSSDGEHWHVVTGAKYQEKIKKEIERQLARERMAKWRASKRGAAVPPPAEPPIEQPSKEESPHHIFIELWSKDFKEAHGIDYAFDGGKDGKAVKTLLAKSKLSPADLVSVARQAWVNPTLFNCKRAVSIHGFCDAFNEVRAELKNLKPPTKRAQIAI